MGFGGGTLRINCRHVVASVVVRCALRRGQFVLHAFRGQTFVLLRWRFRLLRSTVRLSVCGARPVRFASVFGNGVGLALFSVSHAPNNSFKPTPHRGVGRVLYATLARTRRPATGRLNSGVRRQKRVL
jgi:hypothetical protein